MEFNKQEKRINILYKWNSRNRHLCRNSPYFWNSKKCALDTDVFLEFHQLGLLLHFKIVQILGWFVESKTIICVHFSPLFFPSLSFPLSLLYTNIIANWFQERLVGMYFAFYYLMVWMDCSLYVHYADIIIIVTQTLLSHLERCTVSQFLQLIFLVIFVFARFSSLPSAAFLLLLQNLTVSKDQNAI